MQLENRLEIQVMLVSKNEFENYSYIIYDSQSREAFLIDPAWEYSRFCSVIIEKKLKLMGVLLTHSHFDHTNLAKKFNKRIYISEKEATYYNFSCSNMILLQEGDRIRVGKNLINCHLTPGHTKGGMCYFVNFNLFTGDTLFTEGCGICNTEGGSASELYDSIQRLKLLPNNTIVWPGHSYGVLPGKSLEEIKKYNIYLHLNKKAHFIEFANRNR